jgi:hypothetical protein
VVWLLLALVAGVEAVLLAGTQGWIGGPMGIGWRLEAGLRFGFAAELQGWALDNARLPLSVAWRYVTWPWVQSGPLAAVIALALLAGLGKAVATGQGAGLFVAVVLLTPPAAAAAFGLAAGGAAGAWLSGAVPLIFALAGAHLRALGGDRARRRRVLVLVAMLAGGRLLLGLMVEGGPMWAADLTALALGYGLAAALAPGALARLRR